jgi:DNA-binding NarL/FixJ family response regulator
LSQAANDPMIRIFLFIENRLLREALNRLCRKRSDLMVVGEAGYVRSVPPKWPDFQCDVLAFDFFDPHLLSSISDAHGQEPHEFKTMLIDMGNDPRQFLDAVRAGILGYVLKDASACDVIAAIRAVFRREAVCPPLLCAALFQRFAQSPLPANQMAQPGSDLTLRQHQLVNLVARGLTNKEIAAQLNLSQFTVRNHIHRIMRRVEVSSRQEAVRAVRAQAFTATI